MKLRNLFLSMSIKVRIFIIFISLILLTLSTVGVVVFSYWIDSARDVSLRLSRQSNEEILLQATKFLDYPLMLNRVFEDLLTNNLIDMQQEVEREQFFVLSLEKYDEQVYSFSYGTIAGEYFGARRNEDGIVEIMRNNASTGGYSWYYSVDENLIAKELVLEAGLFDPRTRPWYQEAVEYENTVFSSVYKHFVLNDLAVSLSTPVYNKQGVLQGVIGTHMVLSNIDDFLIDILADNNGSGIIIDINTAELIANSIGHENFVLDENNSIKRLTIDEISDSNFLSAYQYYLENNVNDFELRLNQETRYYTVSEIIEDGVAWLIITSIPPGPLLASIMNNIYWMILLFSLSVIIMILVYNMFINKVFKPVTDLVDVSNSYAKGDFSSRANINGNDEISKLGYAFNIMAGEIEAMVENLEQKVSNRTQELSVAYQTLKESEERFKILHNASFGGMAIHDKGTILDCNQGLADITGYTIAELTEMSALALVAKDFRDLVIGNIESGNEKPYEIVGIRKNGEMYPLRVEARNIPYKEKQIRVVEFRDITELRQQEQAKQKSEEKYRLLFETMNQGVMYLDHKGNVTSCNPKAEAILGLSLSQLQRVSLADSPLKMIDENGNEIANKSHPIQLALDTKQNVGPVTLGLYQSKSNDYLWLNIVATPLFESDGVTLNQVYAIFDDITENVISQRKIEEAKAQLQFVMDSLPIGIAVNSVTPEVNFDYMNDNFAKIYGVSKEVLQTQDFWEVVYQDPIYREQIRSKVLEDIASGDISRMKWQDVAIKKENELTRFISAYSTPMANSNQYISTVIDVTDRKNKEDSIQYASNHDSLTELPNRRYFRDMLASLDNVNYYPLGIVFIDLNQLKTLNDAFGHKVGDKALIMVADVLKSSIQVDDFVARIGGDEFAIICPKCDETVMNQLMDRITGRMKKAKIQNLELSAAIGYSIKYDPEIMIDKVLFKAESNMYTDKTVYHYNKHDDVISSILDALKGKYVEEKIHFERVSDYCKRVGEVLGLKQVEINELSMAGMYHDIGKISIPDNILRKSGKLTKKEWEIMKTHTTNGYQILRSSHQYTSIAEYAMSHHERMDGTGYPNGLKGKEIPLFSRIISVVDAYEAMTSDRPYRKAMSATDAQNELRKHAKTQFDPHIVEVFIEQVLKEEKNL